MPKNNLIIQRAFLAVTTGRSNCGYGIDGEKPSQKLFIEFEIVKEITAVVDQEHHEVIDVETQEIFPLVQRDESGRIKEFDFDQIKNGSLVSLRLLDKEWDKMSFMYQLELKNRAKKVYKRYLENKQRENQGPTLTKKKESK